MPLSTASRVPGGAPAPSKHGLIVKLSASAHVSIASTVEVPGAPETSKYRVQSSPPAQMPPAHPVQVEHVWPP